MDKIKNYEIIVSLHIIMSLFMINYKFLAYGLGLLIIIVGILKIINSEDNKSIALYFSIYVLGIEVFFRMIKAGLPWEFGKYSIILFLVLGLYYKTNKSIFIPIFFYFLLLIPSIFNIPSYNFINLKDMISFNLSGPLSLMVTVLYCYNKSINKIVFKHLCQIFLLPIISMIIYIILKMPKFTEIAFSNNANFITSGGFGPNQVSTIIGFCIVVLSLLRFLNIKVFKFTIIDIGLFALLLILGLFTFSRGGMISAIIALFIGYLTKPKEKGLSVFKYFFNGFIILTVVLFSWNIVSNITEGMIASRYLGVYDAETEGFNFTGRLKILETDIEIFKDNFFGVGPGQSKYIRDFYGFRNITAHTEYSRLIAEHGIYGLLSLILLFIVPFSSNIISRPNRIINITFLTLSYLTMFHSSMRLALPGFLFGFAFLEIKNSVLHDKLDNLALSKIN